MKITAQEEYGLRCLLRIARSGANGSVSISEIAESEGLSTPYVAKLCSLLREHKYIEATRGRSGGYRLSNPADAISLGALLVHLGDSLFDDEEFCKRHSGTETNGTCVHHEGGCSLRSLWTTLDYWMRKTLNDLTLADLLNQDQNLEEVLRAKLLEVVQTPRVAPIRLIPLNIPGKKPADVVLETV